MTMKNPFLFVVGCPRSGTTIFMRMLNAHKQIAIMSEIGWIPERFERRDGVTADGLVTHKLIEELAERSMGRYTPLPVSRQQMEEKFSQGPIMYAEFIGWLFDKYGESHGKPLAGNKTVEYALSVRTLHALFPHARIVHLIRDGRDVALSATSWRRAGRLAQRFHTWSTDPIGTAALWWEWHVRIAREAAGEMPEGLYHEVGYEALVARPEAECEALCRFLGVPCDGRMPRYYEGRNNRNSDLGAKHGWAPPTPGLRDWSKQMDRADIERFEAASGDLLDELGYPRGMQQVSAEALEHAANLRCRFEGRPLPKRWGAVSAVLAG